ncbi:hypothetical protein Q2941_47920 [Bradyrhizobium sp. UFLA05-153]
MLLQGFLSALPTNRSQKAPWFSNDNFALSEAFEAVALPCRLDCISRPTELAAAGSCPSLSAARTAHRPGHRPVKITLGEMRATGVRDLLVFCEDYRNVKLEPAYVDRWPDHVPLSDLEPRFICKACGKRGAILRGGSEPTMSIFPSQNRG